MARAIFRSRLTRATADRALARVIRLDFPGTLGIKDTRRNLASRNEYPIAYLGDRVAIIFAARFRYGPLKVVKQTLAALASIPVRKPHVIKTDATAAWECGRGSIVRHCRPRGNLWPVERTECGASTAAGAGKGSL